MNYNKKVNFTHLRSKAYWWRIGLILGVIIVFGITNSGCKKECSNSDEYYVKYEVSSTTIYIGGKLDVTISTENNTNSTFIINQRQLWETTIGPVQKGFNAKLDVKAKSETYDKLKLYAKIYVSKNGSPFAIKKSDGSDTPRDSVKINYIIDY